MTQAFGSPAIWDRVGRYCEARGVRLPTIRRVLSAGAPIPAEVLRRMKACIHPEGEVHTPYGATEALPVASNSATRSLWLSRLRREVACIAFRRETPLANTLTGTAAQTRLGAGVCVGRRFSGVRWKVIRIVDGPIRSIDEIEELPAGEIGELIVARANGHAAIRHAGRMERLGEDRRRSDGLAPHGRQRLFGRGRSVLVLRAGGRTACLRPTGRCIRCVAKRFSTSIPTSVAARWSASGRRDGSVR